MKNGFFYIAFLCMASVFFGCNEQEKPEVWVKRSYISTNVFLLSRPMVTLLSGSEAKLVIYGT